MKLTDTRIRSLKPTPGKAEKHADGGGLFLFVTKAGAKSWRLAYRFHGKHKLLTIGPYPLIGLKDARERREAAKKLLLAGIDPAAEKQAAKAAARIEATGENPNSFETLAREWYETKTEHYTAKHRAKILYRLEKLLFPVFGKKTIREVEAQEILTAARAVEKRGHRETAHRLVQLAGQVFRYAIAIGKARYNVAGDLKDALKPVHAQHRATVIDARKIGALLRALDEYQGHYPVVCALRIMPYVFVRSGELRCATWDEFDFERSEWKIPAERMKMRSPHVVPLARQVVEILQELRLYSGNGRYLFPSAISATRPISDMAMLTAIRRMGYGKEELSIHGFRSMASTLLNEQGYNRDWIERQLAHSEKDGVRAAYNYAEYLTERRKMMQDWADYLTKLKKTAQKEAQKESAVPSIAPAAMPGAAGSVKGKALRAAPRP
jgi:integrase